MNIHTSIDRKILIFSILFVLFTALTELLFFSTYRNFIFKSILTNNFRGHSIEFYAVFFVGYVLACAILLLYVYLSLASTGLIKVLYFFFFALTNFYEYSYQHLYGRFSTIQDLNLAFLTTSTQKVDAFFSYINLAALVPGLVYLTLLLMVRGKQRFTLKKSFAALTAFVLLFSVFNLTMWLAAPRYYFYEAWNNSFGAASRTLYGFGFTKIFYVSGKRETVEKPDTTTLPPNNIVFILDESVRGDHLSLNSYARPTTPFLDELAKQNLLQNWGITSSGSTRSFESFQYAITGVSPDEITDIQQKVKQMPTIFQYAKAMKYNTFYLDGQGNDFWGGDLNDLKYIDVLLGTKYFNPLNEAEWEIDIKIAKKINEIITDSTGNFILVFKRGNHTPYNKNFPPDAPTWQPTATIFAHNLLNLDRETFINTYDNAIRYNLNNFFQTIAADYSQLPNRTTILYSSDHGQTLSEDGEIYSHGGESHKEAVVPLFMFGLNAKVDTNFKAMHANIFATLLDLMNYPEEMRKNKYSISLLKAKESDSKERYFITPNVMPGEKIITTGARIKFD